MNYTRVLMSAVQRDRSPKKRCPPKQKQLRLLTFFGDSLHPRLVSVITGRRAYELMWCVSPSSIRVLVLGETGVGKELAAERIHPLSGWRSAC